MKQFLKKVYENTIANFLKWYRRTFVLKNQKFSIISNNCWGGRVYQRYGLPYTSPTVGLLFFADEYLKFVQNLEYYLSLDLTFIPKKESRYYEFYSEKEKYYPIGVLGDIEIVFLHYKSEQEAYDKWNRRKERINWDNLIVKFNDQNKATEGHIRMFDSLPFKNKICFVANKVPGTKCTIQITEYEGKEYVENDVTKYVKYMDIDNYLNTHCDS